MAKELELKLACTGEVSWADLIACIKALGVSNVEAVSSSRLENTYFDTPALALHLSRVAVRIRKKRDMYIQTFKTAGKSVNGIHQRGEWEWQVPAPSLNLEYLRQLSSWPNDVDSAELGAVFTTDFNRRSCEFVYQNLHFELVLDEGAVVASDAQSGKSLSEPIREIEIELLGAVHDGVVNEGAPAESTAVDARVEERAIEVISGLASSLLDVLAVERSDVSKAQRGYALFERLRYL